MIRARPESDVGGPARSRPPCLEPAWAPASALPRASVTPAFTWGSRPDFLVSLLLSATHMVLLDRIASIMLVAAAATAAHAESAPPSELQNDGWFPGTQLGFATGLKPGDVVASRFRGSGNLIGVQLVFGGATTAQTVTIKVWDDTAAALGPGAELFSGDFQLDGFDGLQYVALPGLAMPFRFRIGVVAHHTGAPSVAFDRDGTIAPDANFVMKQGAWLASAEPGDWIIRAQMLGGVGGGGDAGFPDGGAGGGGNDAGFPDGNAGDTGCCRAGSGVSAGAPLGLGVLGLLVLRRGRRRGEFRARTPCRPRTRPARRSACWWSACWGPRS